MLMDIERRAALPFPQSLPEFQRLFPDDAACAEYLEKLRWTNPLRGSRVIETAFSDFTGAIAEDPLPLA